MPNKKVNKLKKGDKYMTKKQGCFLIVCILGFVVGFSLIIYQTHLGW